MTSESGRAGKISQPNRRLIALGCLTAIGASLITIVMFGILTPSRDIASLLNPPVVPTPTAPATAISTIPPVPPLLLEDNFSTRTNWPRLIGDAPYGYMENGYLLAPQKSTNYVRVFLSSINAPSVHNLSLQITASPLEGSSAVNYGAFFWHSQDKNGREQFLYFGVGSDGVYTLRALVPTTTSTKEPYDGHWVDLVKATPSAIINKGIKSNQLRIDVHPHRVIAFINGDRVFDRDNPDVDAYRNGDNFDGKVGLLAFSTGDSTAKVVYTHFALYADTGK